MTQDTTFYLLDILREKAGCEYVSGLRFMDNRQILRLASRLDNLDAEDFILQEWNDALIYILNETARETPEDAKTALQSALFKKITGDPAVKQPE